MNVPDLNGHLRALRESMRDAAAPDRVEAALLAAFRQRRQSQRVGANRRWLLWPVAAAAVLAVAAFVALLPGPRRIEPIRPAVATPALTAAPPALVEPAAPTPATRRRAAPARTKEVATDFIPLVTQAAWGPGDSVQIIRVRVPRTDLIAFGMPLNPERAFELVKADIVLGQDGVARAVRLVR